MSILGHKEILELIPHAGSMCLLDEVLNWNAVLVRCLSRRYHELDNPLRRTDGKLGAACGIEIAAQAMAVHGRLTAPADTPPMPGYLVSLRNVRLAAPVLDGGTGDLLLVEAHLMAGGKDSASYEFVVSSRGTPWVEGRAVVLFGAAR